MKKVALIDGDILCYEYGGSGTFVNKNTGDTVYASTETVLDYIRKKLEVIVDEVQADEWKVFITDKPEVTEWYNNRLVEGQPKRVYVPGFRFDVAKTKEYKATRKQHNMYHFEDVRIYLLSLPNTCISDNGLEADDEMVICARRLRENGDEPIICSRDKDLRIAEGTHYSWESGRQRSIGPVQSDRLGWLETYEKPTFKRVDAPSERVDTEAGQVEVARFKYVPAGVKPETIGYGLSFFFYQLLVGDSADNIPGLPGVGDKRARKILEGCLTESSLFKACIGAYLDVLGKERSPRNDPFGGRVLEEAEIREYWREQADLLWMCDELDDEGKPKRYEYGT